MLFAPSKQYLKQILLCAKHLMQGALSICNSSCSQWELRVLSTSQDQALYL